MEEEKNREIKKEDIQKENRKKQLSLKRANIRNSRSVLPMSAFSRTIAFKLQIGH